MYLEFGFLLDIKAVMVLAAEEQAHTSDKLSSRPRVLGAGAATGVHRAVTLVAQKPEGSFEDGLDLNRVHLRRTRSRGRYRRWLGWLWTG